MIWPIIFGRVVAIVDTESANFDIGMKKLSIEIPQPEI